MKKILFIHHAAGWGGAPKAMINLINSLDRSKYEIEVLLIKNSVVVKKLEESGIKYSIASSLFYQKYYACFIHSEAGYYKWYQLYYLIKFSCFWILSRFYYAKKELAKHDFDIVHLNSSVLNDWLAPARAKGKVIIHIREPFRKGKYDFLHYVFISQMRKYAHKIIAISKDNAKRIAIENKTVVVYDYSEVFSELPYISSYFSKKVLYLGGSESMKGFYQMVEALNYLESDIRVYFAGNYAINKTDGKIKTFIKYFISDDKLKRHAITKMRTSSNAIEIGIVYNIPKYLDEVCCLISPFDRPHFSLPVIEAFANHKPVIVTNIEGADEIVKHMKNGLVVPKANSKELAKAINYMCNNGNQAQEMGNNGFKDSQEKFSANNMKKIADIYDRL